jgi:hypothetical protein
MTMPQLMNCPHSGDGWCLACVAHCHARIEKLQAELTTVRAESHAAAHVIIEAGLVPGLDLELACRCEQCKLVATRMAEAGYLDDLDDRWWEHTDG